MKNTTKQIDSDTSSVNWHPMTPEVRLDVLQHLEGDQVPYNTGSETMIPIKRESGYVSYDTGSETRYPVASEVKLGAL